MLQTLLDTLIANPATATGMGALALSEIMGFTRKGGLIKGLLLLIIALGRAAAEFRRAQSEIQETKDIQRAAEKAEREE